MQKQNRTWPFILDETLAKRLQRCTGARDVRGRHSLQLGSSAVCFMPENGHAARCTDAVLCMCRSVPNMPDCRSMHKFLYAGHVLTV